MSENETKTILEKILKSVRELITELKQKTVMETSIQKIKRSVFKKELNRTLTILDQDENIYICEYITPALYKKIITIKVID